MQQWAARFRRFMGWNLPKRRLDLNFDLLPPSRRGQRPHLGSLALAGLRKQSNNDRNKFLQALHHELKLLNRYSFGTTRRLGITSIALRAYYPIAVECLALYSKEAGVPDDEARQTALDEAAGIARALATSYKHLFQSYYDSSRFMYARNRSRIYRCSVRILELIRLEQRLLGLRYRRLPARAWQDANTLFTVLASYENVEFPLPRLDSELREDASNRVASPLDHYTAVQAYALLDHTNWPTEQHSFIDSYRESLDSPVNATLGAAGKGPDTLYASAYHAGPPVTENPPEHKGEVICINCSVLAKSIRADYKDLIRAKSDDTTFHVPPLLAPLQEVYRISIASLMNRNVNNRMRWLDIDHSGDPLRGLHIYVGFGPIEQHLKGIFSQDARLMHHRRLADSLADRSALFGQDHTATEESLWHVLYSDHRLFGLQTQETRYTTPMNIGSLIAYGVGVEDRGRPRLGTVSRIFRPQTGSVMLEVMRLANFAEPVIIAKDLQKQGTSGAQEDNTPSSGFMVYDKRYGWGLLLPNLAKFWQNSAVIMQRDGRALKFRLGGVKALTQNFILFTLPKQFQALGEPEYPEPRVTREPGMERILDTWE